MSEVSHSLKPTSSPAALQMRIAADASVELGGVRLHRKYALKSKLRKLRGDADAPRELQVHVDKAASFELVAAVLTIVQRMGGFRIALLGCLGKLEHPAGRS